MLKKDKMVSCEAPGCTNRADKNSNIITLVSYNDNVFIIISWHIPNPSIFNT